MVKQSLEASFTKIREAKKAFAHKVWTQDNLVFEVNLKTRQTNLMPPNPLFFPTGY